MSSEEPPPPGESPRRRPPTLELTAEEAHTAQPAGGASTSTQSQAPPRWSTVPLIAAAVGAVLIMLALVALFALRAGDERKLDARFARLEQALREQASRPPPERNDGARVEELAGRLARMEATLAAQRPPAPDTALANRISALEAELKTSGERVANLSRRSDESAAGQREARQRAEAAAAALAELSQKVSRPEAPAIAHSELDTLANRVAAVERAIKANEAEPAKRRDAAPAAGRDQAARLAVLAAALQGAVQRSEPFAVELAALKALGANPEPLAALEGFAASGVPPAAALGREFAGLLPTLNTAAGAPPRNGILEKLQANAEKIVRIRPLEAASGNDAATIVARAEEKAARADLAGALAELGQLPPDMRAPAEPWIQKVEARAAAVAASRRLAAAAITGLR